MKLYLVTYHCQADCGVFCHMTSISADCIEDLAEAVIEYKEDFEETSNVIITHWEIREVVC